MKKSLACLLLILVCAAARADVQVYSSGAATVPGSEWSASHPLTTFAVWGSDSLKLSLPNLPTHGKVTVSFSLALKGWMGNDKNTGGASIFDLASDAQPILHTTFGGADTTSPAAQAYPGQYPGSGYPAWYGCTVIIPAGDVHTGPATYGINLSYTVNDSRPSVAFVFSGINLSYEYWQLSNVTVTVDAAPLPKISDQAVYRPSTGEWFFHKSNGDGACVQWGGPGDVPVPGDYLGKGSPQLAVYRPSTCEWFILGPSGLVKVQWGGPGDIPMPGDYLGLGRVLIAIFRPATQQWFIRQDNGTPLVLSWGTTGDVPIAMKAPTGF